jgi:hypothetical protein
MSNRKGTAPSFDDHQAPPEYDVAATNDFAFLSAVTTLQASSEWHTQTIGGWVIMLILAIYGFNTIDASNNQYERLLMYVLVVYSCFSAVHLSSMVRDRQEASLMQRFGANSRLYSPSTIATLMGNSPKFYLNWTIFGGTLLTLLYMFNNMGGSGNDGALKRYFVAGSVLSLISMTFTLAKQVRDSQDAKRMRGEYRLSTNQHAVDM